MEFVHYPDSLTNKFWQDLTCQKLHDLAVEKKFSGKISDLEERHKKIWGEVDHEVGIVKDFDDAVKILNRFFNRFDRDIEVFIGKLSNVKSYIGIFYSKLKSDDDCRKVLKAVKADIIQFRLEIDDARKKIFETVVQIRKDLELARVLLSKCLSGCESFSKSLEDLVENPCNEQLKEALNQGDEYSRGLELLYNHINKKKSFTLGYVSKALHEHPITYWNANFLEFSMSRYTPWSVRIVRLKTTQAQSGLPASYADVMAILMAQTQPHFGLLEDLAALLTVVLRDIESALACGHRRL